MSNAVSRAFAPLFVLSAVACPALAHSTFETATVTQNAYTKMVLRVPHGCKGEATLSVRVDLPEGIVSVKPMPKAGWTLATTKGPLAKPHVSHGREITEGVKRIVWSGGNLPDDHYDEFVFTAQFTEALPAGQTVYIPVVQSCAKGEAAWTQIPATGQDAHALASPAPGVKVLAQAKTGDTHAGHMAPAAVAPSPLKIEQVWTRATPNGAQVAGGFLKITNTGSTPDRLVGGSAEIAKVFEVHEMKHEGGMMKMRAVEGGLEIKPGETLELKPGGYHVMLIDLTRPIKEGDTIKGTLTFEKAGTIPVEFKAAGMGAGAPKAGNHSHGH